MDWIDDALYYTLGAVQREINSWYALDRRLRRQEPAWAARLRARRYGLPRYQPIESPPVTAQLARSTWTTPGRLALERGDLWRTRDFITHYRDAPPVRYYYLVAQHEQSPRTVRDGFVTEWRVPLLRILQPVEDWTDDAFRRLIQALWVYRRVDPCPGSDRPHAPARS